MTYYYENKKYKDFTKLKYITLEYQKCYREIIDNIKQRKPFTKYYIKITAPKPEYVDWDPVIVAFHLLKKLKKEEFVVEFNYPNKLIIFHPPMVSKKAIEEKEAIYKYMINMHYKSLSSKK